MVVWAENPRMAAEEAERRGVDFVLRIGVIVAFGGMFDHFAVKAITMSVL